jgi:hypothetical protein
MNTRALIPWAMGLVMLFAGCNRSTTDTTNGTSSNSTTGSVANKVFFLHHSTGEGLVVGGNMRSVFTTYNTQHGTSLAFWDHEYNAQGLRNASGNLTGTNYAIPNDNTDPEGLYLLWTSSDADWTSSRNQILNNYKVIAFKSCFPASAIPDAATLAQYHTWYLAMRDVFDAHTDRVFVVISPPPLHRLASNATEAANARAFATWLAGSTYPSGHSNVVCFNLFDYLAQADDGSASANMLRYDYESDHNDSDSHPNTLANQTVGPIFAQFLIDTAMSH